jgi:hypothetical protein
MRNLKRALATALIGLLLLGACRRPAEPMQPVTQPGGWHEFEGSWIGAGDRHVVALGPSRYAAVVALSGTLLLAGPSAPGVGFRGDAVALNDSSTGLVGRVVWTDERGDEVYSELRGQGILAGQRITGTFVGGTGRYAGATGTYEFSWQYVLENEDGTVQGRAVGLKGRVRFVPSASPSTVPGGNP